MVVGNPFRLRRVKALAPPRSHGKSRVTRWVVARTREFSKWPWAETELVPFFFQPRKEAHDWHTFPRILAVLGSLGVPQDQAQGYLV